MGYACFASALAEPGNFLASVCGFHYNTAAEKDFFISLGGNIRHEQC
jgi:hypothetical protein